MIKKVKLELDKKDYPYICSKDITSTDDYFADNWYGFYQGIEPIAIACIFKENQTFTVLYFEVKKDLKKMGIGSAFLKEIVETAVKEKMAKIELVAKTEEIGEYFYKKMGFEWVDEKHMDMILDLTK